ncbi:MAG: EAL domain-containing protein [Roseburia sp.]
MQYNFDYEIASLVVIMIVSLHVIFVRQFPSDKARCFKVLLWTCALECMANIFSSIGLANTSFVPLWVNDGLAFVFFVLEGLASFVIYRYLMVVCELTGRAKWIAGILGIIPFVVFELLVILNPFIKFFYYFEDDRYCQGFGADFGYWYIAYYFLLNLTLVIARRKIVGQRTKWIVWIYTAVAVGAIYIQFEVRGLLLTSAANAVIILMIYLSMQNPSELLDPVTGVGNESAFLQQLKNGMKHTNREMEAITIKIRKFHQISAVIGVENSNSIMLEIGRYLYQLCGKFQVFRTTETTFSILVEPNQSEVICEVLQERFDREWMVGQNQIMINMNIVRQHYPQSFSTSSEYLGMREFLLEEVETLGNLAILKADEEYVKRYKRRTAVELAVTRAIHNRTFEVYYQPIYSLKEHRIVYLEALVRLNDAELGFIPPDEFISLAERDGNIIHIGEIVLDECCKFVKDYILPDDAIGIRTIHVNISMAQCMRENLTDMILPVIERYQIPPSYITLEITERTAIETPELMKKHMEKLGQMGISFAMDDYGSGNSNCTYLVQFPFQEVKVDKKFTWAYFEQESARIVLQNEIKTIQKLGLSLVIEGVETQEQSDEMERLGVDYIQGYYYGKPMPQAECINYLHGDSPSRS